MHTTKTKLIVLILVAVLAGALWLVERLQSSSDVKLHNVGGTTNQCTCSQRIER